MQRRLGPFSATNMVLVCAVCSWAGPPPKVSRTAYSTMMFRTVAAQDPDPQTRNPDYLPARLCDLSFIREKMSLSLGLGSGQAPYRQEKDLDNLSAHRPDQAH